MRVKILTNLGSRDYPDHELMEGEIADVPDDVGSVMVKRHHAAIVADEPSKNSLDKIRDLPTHKKVK